jgi:hypothetical protein
MSKLSEQQRRDLLAGVNKRDEDIDLSDIPEIREIPPDAVRGKFYRPGATAQVPIYLNKGLQDYLLAAAERKGITLSDLVNDLLSKEVAIVEAIK